MNPHDSEKLERLIHQTLRSLPDRRAPHTLEGRVFAALAARAALPWWRQSFASWPLAARVAFFVFCAGLAKLVVLATVFVLGDLDAAQFTRVFATEFGWIEQARSVADGTANFCGLVYRAIPPLWLYGGLALVITLYTALFGLGAAAYRTLYAQR
jgi:hypothetical protein